MSDPMNTDPSIKPAAQGLIARVTAILTKPAQTWDDIAAEPGSIQSIYMGYILPLAAIGPLAYAIGSVVFGQNIGFFGFGVTYHTPILSALIMAIYNYIMTLVGVFVVGLIIDALAPSFDGQKNSLAAFKVAAYSATAGWVAAVFGLLPSLALLAAIVGGLYGLYITYIGLPKLMKNPPEKTIVYMVVIAAVVIVVALVVGGIATVTGLTSMGAPRVNPFGLNQTSTPFGPAGNSTIAVNGGTATVNLGQMAAAASQMAAQASAQQNGTAAPVKLADPQALLALMPDNYDGAAKSNTSTSSGGAAGMAVATAEATYNIGNGNIHLTITDAGTLTGLTGIATAMNLNTSSSSGSSYDKVVSANGQTTDESYDGDSKSGKYSILANGISVDAEGSGVDIGTIKSLVSQIDLGKAQALAH